MKASLCLNIAKTLAILCGASVLAGTGISICIAMNGMDGQLSLGLAICIFAAIQELIFGSLFALIAELKLDQGETK